MLPFPKNEPPPMVRVLQHFPPDRIADVRNTVRQKLLESRLLDTVSPGAKIAITAGSRGMGAFLDLLSGIVDAVRSRGGEPFIIPAMGSHGGSTREGQTEILRRLGVTEHSVGAPVQATMQTRVLGTCTTGAIAHLDDVAARSDGIIVLGRTRTHPENKEGVASGLLKMVTVGLGKQAGAQEAHTHGLWDSVKAVPQITLERSKILCGVTVVENAFREPAVVEVVSPKYAAFLEADERLLEISKKYFAEIPFAQLDVLVVDELGKNISGTGLDLNVIGKWRMEGGEREPDFRRIAVLSLTAESLGNGLGIGLADFTTERFVEEFDWTATYINLFTATEPGVMNSREGQLPLALPSDKEAIQAALFSALANAEPRICRIRNTARLDEFWVSESLLGEVDGNDKLSHSGKSEPMAFNANGNLF